MKRLVGLFVVILAGAAAVLPALAEDNALSAEANAAFLADNARKKGVITRPDGLEFKILQNGYGAHPMATDIVTVYYTGMLINGVVFDGTSPGLPATFTVNSLIPGWTEALETMRVGDRWQVVVPPNLAYGERGTPDGSVPPGQTLVFDLQLLSTKAPPKKGEPGYVPGPGESDDDSGR